MNTEVPQHTWTFLILTHSVFFTARFIKLQKRLDGQTGWKWAGIIFYFIKMIYKHLVHNFLLDVYLFPQWKKYWFVLSMDSLRCYKDSVAEEVWGYYDIILFIDNGQIRILSFIISKYNSLLSSGVRSQWRNRPDEVLQRVWVPGAEELRLPDPREAHAAALNKRLSSLWY